MFNILKYPGGQAYQAKLIANMMCPHQFYVEPFLGGASVFFAKQDITSLKTSINILSDINGELMNFWQFIRDHSEIMRKALLAVPYSKKAFDIWKNQAEPKPLSVVSAMRYFILSRMSRGGLRDDFSESARQRRGKPEGESAYETAINNFPLAASFFKGSSLYTRDFEITIKEWYKEKRALMFVDPPFLPETRVAKEMYIDEMSIESHHRLLNLLVCSEAKIILAGYDSELYRDILKGWTIIKLDQPNRQGQGKTLSRKVQCMWRNYW